MGHTYSSTLVHVVFSTKGRKPVITTPIREKLWAYMGGIARKNGFKALAVGGVEDHAHLLLQLPTDLSVAKAVQLIKGGSSKWAHGQVADFAWQQGFGAFSIGISQLDATVAYIRGQERHHRKVDFMQEFIAFLKKHKIEYDERYVWG
jgi:putative transposase